MPWVVEAACWRNGDDVGVRAKTSMGMDRRAAAKMVFIRGMYCEGEAGEAERMRMREDCEGDPEAEVDAMVALVGLEEKGGEMREESLLAFARARVRAPARAVVGVVRDAGGVEARRAWREEVRACEIVAKGR